VAGDAVDRKPIGAEVIMYIKRINFRDEKGVALLMTLMISLIALSVMASLMYMMTMGARISGLNKRFNTALEAGRGSHAVVREFIGTRGIPDAAFMNSINWNQPMTTTCENDKLREYTADWDPSCNASTIIDIADDATYDFSFQMDGNNYTVYAKIVNTIWGNTSSGGTSNKFGVYGHTTASGGGGTGSLDAVAIPYLYTLEVDARRTSAPDDEKARLSILYQY
jgi:hypothetical protein